MENLISLGSLSFHCYFVNIIKSFLTDRLFLTLVENKTSLRRLIKFFFFLIQDLLRLYD